MSDSDGGGCIGQLLIGFFGIALLLFFARGCSSTNENFAEDVIREHSFEGADSVTIELSNKRENGDVVEFDCEATIEQDGKTITRHYDMKVTHPHFLKFWEDTHIQLMPTY